MKERFVIHYLTSKKYFFHRLNKLLKNTSLYAIGNILPQAASIILLPIYAKYMSPAEYGIISSMYVFSSILIILFTLAVDRSIFRLYYDYTDENEQRNFLGTITLTVLGVSTVILVFLFLFSSVVNKIFPSIEFYPYYSYTLLAVFFSVFSIIPKVYLQIKERADKFLIISISQFLLSTGLVLWFVVFKDQGAEGMLKGRMIAEMLLVPFMIIFLARIINFTIRKSLIVSGLKFSLPLIPNIALAWVLDLSDRIFIERYFSLNEVGIYSLGYKIAGLVLILSGAFQNAYNPLFYKLSNSEDQVEARRNLFKYNRIFGMAVIVTLFVVALFSKEAVEIFFDDRYIEAYRIVPLIAFSYMISQISGLFNLMIYQVKKVKQLMYVSFFGGGLNVVFNFLLIPEFGMYGAAYATIASFLVIFIFSWRLARRCYYIPVAWIQLLFALLICLSVWLLFYFLDLRLVTSLVLKAMVILGAFFYLIKKNQLVIPRITNLIRRE